MTKNSPPYEITQEILNLVAEISELLGRINSSHLIRQSPELRKKNRILTIQASLEIEGNTLSIEEITAIFDKKRIIGKDREIWEVQNAIKAYDILDSFKSHSLTSFYLAHKILMSKLIPYPGKFRTGNVGIAKKNKVTHIAPDGAIVKGLMRDLFSYLKSNKDNDLHSAGFEYLILNFNSLFFIAL